MLAIITNIIENMQNVCHVNLTRVMTYGQITRSIQVKITLSLKAESRSVGTQAEKPNIRTHNMTCGQCNRSNTLPESASRDQA